MSSFTSGIVVSRDRLLFFTNFGEWMTRFLGECGDDPNRFRGFIGDRGDWLFLNSSTGVLFDAVLIFTSSILIGVLRIKGFISGILPLLFSLFFLSTRSLVTLNLTFSLNGVQTSLIVSRRDWLIDRLPMSDSLSFPAENTLSYKSMF